MRKRILFGAAIVLLACNGTEQPEPVADLSYSLTPVFEGNEIRLDVQAVFKGDMDGMTKIRVGGRWKRDKKAGKRFRDLEVSGEAVELPVERNQPLWTITHAPGAELTINYHLSSEDMDDASTNIEYFYSSVLLPDVIHLLGSTSLVIPVPDGSESAFDTDELNIEVLWKNLPEGWTYMDSLPGRPISPRAIGSQILAAAPTDFVSVTDGSYKLTVLKAGVHDFSVEEFNSQMISVYEGLNRLWRADEPEFLVTLLGTPENVSYSSFTGTGRYNSFASAATKGIDLDFLIKFLAHEVAHHWVPGELGSWANCPESESCPPQIKWFSEGFTDFVMTRAMLSEGRWSEAELVEFTNQYLRDYYLSSARSAKGHDIDAKFWTDTEIERQPYWRGYLLAMNWNTEIERATNGKSSAMEVLREMYEAAKTAPEGNYPKLTPEYIAQNFSAKAERDVFQDVERFYHQGELIKPNPKMFAGCAALSSEASYNYDVGFDAQYTLSTGVVSGVANDHNSAKAGLKNGQIFLAKIAGGGGDTKSPLILEVKENVDSKALTVSYLPVSGSPTVLPQFVLDKNCAN